MKRILQFTQEQHIVGMMALLGVGVLSGIFFALMQLGVLMEMLKN